MEKEGVNHGRNRVWLTGNPPGDGVVLDSRIAGRYAEGGVMTAIGFAYKSERDEVNGWESVTVEPMPRLKAAYETAKNDAEDAWDWFYQMVDQLEDTYTRFPNDSDKIKWARGLVSEAREKAEAADKNAKTAYDQMNCDHVNREMMGAVEVCLDCGAKF